MSNIYSSVNLAPAAGGNLQKFDLSNTNFTTMDFAQLVPVQIFDCVPKDQFELYLRVLSRVAPMVFPTYGDIGLRLISAWVPYYLLADDATSYITGIKYHGGKLSKGRFLTQDQLDILVWSDAYHDGTAYYSSNYLTYVGSSEATSSSPGVYKPESLDGLFIKYNSGANTGQKGIIQYFRLNSKGKYLVKVLENLGYRVNNVLSFYLGSGHPDYISSTRKLKLNAYPLLAYFKLYADFLIPTSYYLTSPLLSFLEGVKTSDSTYVNSNGSLVSSKLTEILDVLSYVFYDSDYFTSAWQSPNSPLSSTQSSISDFREGRLNVEMSSDNISSTVSLKNGVLSARQLDFLRSFDNFVRRNNLVGYKEFNAIYARFGIKPSEMKSQYVQILDVQNLRLNVGDVTSTAQTDGTDLGAFAGKGFVNGDGNIKFECKDYGMFIQVAHLYVKPVYFQGIRKHCLRVDPFDFFQPEFDGVGPAPISKSELNSNWRDEVFGYTERYNEYRSQLSNVSGDFKFDPQMYPWHTGRVFDDASPVVAQSDNMIKYNVDDAGNSEYDRLFAIQSVKDGIPIDHFFMQLEYKVNALRPIKSMSEAQGLKSGSLQLDRNGSI